MSIKQVNIWVMVFTPCFTLIAGIFIGMTVSDQKHINEKEWYCKPIPEIMMGARICKPK